MTNTDYVKVASFLFLKKHKEKTGNNSTGVMFNKYMTLLNRELLSKGIDIKLPHCWYRWGDEVVRYSMPYIDWNHEDIGTTSVKYSDKRPKYNPRDQVICIADKFADDFLGRYSGPRGQEEAIDEVYSDAPFKFQNDFRQLREALKISRKNNPLRNYHKYIQGLFSNATESFPPEFGYLSQHFERFRSAFSLALSKNAKPEDLFEISETFWFFFCYHLRLNNKCHENVPQSTLDVWREVLPAEEDKYTMFVQNQVAEYCPSGGSGDPVIDVLIRDRNVRLKESDSLFTKVFG